MWNLNRYGLEAIPINMRSCMFKYCGVSNKFYNSCAEMQERSPINSFRSLLIDQNPQKMERNIDKATDGAREIGRSKKQLYARKDLRIFFVNESEKKKPDLLIGQ